MRCCVSHGRSADRSVDGSPRRHTYLIVDFLLLLLLLEFPIFIHHQRSHFQLMLIIRRVGAGVVGAGVAGGVR